MPKNCFDKDTSKLIVEPEYSLETILQGRKNYKSYSFFFDSFFPLMEKKSKFKYKMIRAARDEDLVSISSEAFCLLVLENHWERWLEIYEKCGGRIGIRGGTKLKGMYFKSKPKYTRGGLNNGGGRDIGIGKGWSYEGIYRFNILFQFIRNDRLQNPHFITKWISEKRKTFDNITRKINKPEYPEIFVQWTLSEKESDGATDETNQTND